jgi:hypothetical protein
VNLIEYRRAKPESEWALQVSLPPSFSHFMAAKVYKKYNPENFIKIFRIVFIIF